MDNNDEPMLLTLQRHPSALILTVGDLQYRIPLTVGAAQGLVLALLGLPGVADVLLERHLAAVQSSDVGFRSTAGVSGRD